MELLNTAYLGVMLIGLLHGLEPGHGWPVAVLYSTRKGGSTWSATISSGIIGLAHLVSSVAVVAAYVWLRTILDFNAPWLKYLAAGLLVAIAVKMFLEKADGLEKQHGHIHEHEPDIEHEHEHEHPGKELHTHLHKHATGITLSLWGLASFAFILGFAHEEEFALLALATSGVNAWLLMVLYGVCVLAGLIAVTVLSVKLFRKFHRKIARYEKYVPKIGALILVVMAVLIIIVD
jgi:nickel/cobalt exporter